MKAISGPPMAIATILENPSSVKNGLGSPGSHICWCEPSRCITITWSITRTINVRRPQARPVRPFVAHDWHPIRKLTTNIDRPGPSVIVRRSQLLETLHPLGATPFVDALLAANPRKRAVFLLDHSHYGSPGQLQQLSGLLDGQQSHRLKITFHRRFHGIPSEQRQCHDPSKHSRPFSAKNSNLADQLNRTEFDQPDPRRDAVKS